MVSFKNISYRLSLPFRHLSTQERIIQSIRLFCSISVVVYCLVCVLAPLFTNTTYMARINCSQLDVSRGLFQSLRQTVTANSPDFDDDFDSDNDFEEGVAGGSLTNSEIELLSQYAERKVAGAPQYIIISLWNWCFGDYQTETTTDSQGNKHTIKKNEVVICQDSKDVFNYHYELSTVGLDSILAYAYRTTSYSNANYNDIMNKRHSQFRLVPPAFIFCAISQFILLLMIFIIYSNRNGESDLSKIPNWILHAMACISLASFISIIVGASLITYLLAVTRKEISHSLASFGVTFHFGPVWITLLYFGVAFALISMCTWTLPMWCANPEEDQEEVFKFISSSENLTIEKPRKRIHWKFPGIRIKTNPENENISTNIHDGPRLPVKEHEIQLEQELRKLGHSISKRPSVRKTTTRNIRLSNPFVASGIYQEEVYDGYASSSASIARTNTIGSLKDPFLDEDQRPDSYLADEEMQLLENPLFRIDND